jgi:hypothetical protein
MASADLDGRCRFTAMKAMSTAVDSTGVQEFKRVVLDVDCMILPDVSSNEFRGQAL